MTTTRHLLVATCLAGMLVSTHADLKVEDNSETLSFKPPVLTEEEQHSNNLPKHMQCDSCHAAVYQLTTRYARTEKMSSKKGVLTETQQFELGEEACLAHTYDEYGTKEVDGRMRINGPGVAASENKAGMIMGGGKWPGRLSQYCNGLIEEHGEDGLYAIYREHRVAEHAVREFICAKDCAPEPEKTKRAKKKKKKTKAKSKSKSKAKTTSKDDDKKERTGEGADSKDKSTGGQGGEGGEGAGKQAKVERDNVETLKKMKVRIPGTKEEAKQKYKEALENAINKGKKGGAGKKKKKTQKKKKTTNSKKDEL